MIKIQESILLKLSMVLFLAPVLFVFYMAARNNAEHSLWDIVFVYGYILVFSFGLPIFMARAAFLAWKKDTRGFRLMRNISVIMLLGVGVLAIGFYVVPPEIACSETEGICPEKSFLPVVLRVLLLEWIYLFSFFMSRRALRAQDISHAS